MRSAEDTLIHSLQKRTIARSDVIRGIGDDAAICFLSKNQQLVIATDTLVAGQHFFSHTFPADIGYKALAVSLSDCAAMGAKPAWVLMNLVLPNFDATWLDAYTQGFFALANQHNIQLIGGDTCQGPLMVTTHVLGHLASNQAPLLRNKVCVGDCIMVTGTLGDAGLGLRVAQNHCILNNAAHTEYVLQRLNRPEPQIAAGIILRDFSHAAIDISDGLLLDLERMLSQSRAHTLDQPRLGAKIQLQHLPLSAALSSAPLPLHEIWQLALSAGDDYQLCFTVPSSACSAVTSALSEKNIACRCIGEVTENHNIELIQANGDTFECEYKGFQHFERND